MPFDSDTVSFFSVFCDVFSGGVVAGCGGMSLRDGNCVVENAGKNVFCRKYI